MRISPLFQKYEGRTHTDNTVIPYPPFLHGCILRVYILMRFSNHNLSAIFLCKHNLLTFHNYFIITIIIIIIVILVTDGADLRHYWAQYKN